MTLVPTLSAPTTGQARVPAPLVANDNAIRDVVNGNLDYTNLADSGVTTAKIAAANVTADKLADAAKLGLSDSTYVRRGKSIIATEESFTQTSYGFATTPDRVQNIVLPTDGLIFVLYEANWNGSVDNAASAAIFVGATQLSAVGWDNFGNYSPGVQAAANTGASPAVNMLTTFGQGLVSVSKGSGVTLDSTIRAVGADMLSTSASAYIRQLNGGGARIDGGTRDIGIGGICPILAPAGTYDIGIKYKSSSGSVTVKNRKLWVWTQSF